MYNDLTPPAKQVGFGFRLKPILTKAFIFTGGQNYSFAIWISSSVITSWPGTLIQLIFIPSILVGLMKAHLIPERYIKEKI